MSSSIATIVSDSAGGQGRSQGGGGAQGARAPPMVTKILRGSTAEKLFHETKSYFLAGVHPP